MHFLIKEKDILVIVIWKLGPCLLFYLVKLLDGYVLMVLCCGILCKFCTFFRCSLIKGELRLLPRSHEDKVHRIVDQNCVHFLWIKILGETLGLIFRIVCIHCFRNVNTENRTMKTKARLHRFALIDIVRI